MRRIICYSLAFFILSSSCLLLMGAINVRGQYTSHSPIKINSNADFLPANGITGGSGTVGDPWIIEGYDINGSGLGTCIYIGNTTDYFIIQNCYLHNAYSEFLYQCEHVGLLLHNVSNGTISKNTISNNNFHGIELEYASKITIIDNALSHNNRTGIMTEWSYDNIIKNNSINYTAWVGIYATGNNNSVINNIVENNDVGIRLTGTNISVVNNTVNNNSGHGITLNHYTWYNSISTNQITNNFYGIFLAGPSNRYNNISNNRIEDNFRGLVLYGSIQNNFINNTIASNSNIGIQFESARNNLFTHNKIYNEWILLRNCTNNTYIHNINQNTFLQIKDEYDNNLDTTLIAEAYCNKTNYRGENVILNGANSTGHMGIITYNWKIDYYGTPVTLDGPVVNYKFWTAGNYTISLTVVDGLGFQATTNLNLTILDHPLDHPLEPQAEVNHSVIGFAIFISVIMVLLIIKRQFS